MGTAVAVFRSIKENLYVPLFKKVWPVWAGALAFAVTNVLMAAYARGLGVFPQLSMWGASIINAIGIKTQAPFAAYPVTPILNDSHSMINFGIVFGVLGAALLSREFKLRTDSWRGYAQGFLGGALMGWGTVLTPPCNVGGFGTAIMALSLSGFLMAIGLLLGGFVGARILMWQAKRAISGISIKEEPARPVAEKAYVSRQPVIGWIVIALLFVAVAVYAGLNKPNFGVLLLFGAAFGIIFQRSRLCFAAAFRDVFTTKDTRVLRWILVSLAVGMVGFSILKFKGFIPADHFVFPAGLHNVAGGFVFGIGMVIAGGCGVGVLWRSAEGYVRHWFAILGGMLTAGSWVLLYGHQVGQGWIYSSSAGGLGKVFLPTALGWGGALAAAALTLAAFYTFLTWLEAKKR